MATALLLIDLQTDYLSSPTLSPCCEQLVDHASELLAAFRSNGRPVVHVWTTINHPSQAMPHWQTQGRQFCRRGTPGHATPPDVEPLPGEHVHHKTVFSAFADGSLAPRLRQQEVDTLVLAGLHLRTCVRTAALDAYQLGLRVWIATEAVADDDPLHAELSREYLQERAIPFLSTEALLKRLDEPTARQPPTLQRAFLVHVSPSHPWRVLWQVKPANPERIDIAVRSTAELSRSWGALPIATRRSLLAPLLPSLERERQDLAWQITHDTGKPIRASVQEVDFAIALLEDILRRSHSSPSHDPGPSIEQRKGWKSCRRPHGVVAAVMPWNNPLAIPLGKLIPALLYGNTVALKPALPGTGLARRLQELLRAIGLPDGSVELVEGGAATAVHLMNHPEVAAITITGGSRAGMAAQIASARRRLPLQAELGGNNAAIVWRDADLPVAAKAVVEGAFASAGQRCTANRRVIVDASVAARFVDLLTEASAELFWGDPFHPETVIGPVISLGAAHRLRRLIARAQRGGAAILQPQTTPRTAAPHAGYVPPTLVLATDPAAEWVQEESFGPLLVVQMAADWDEAMELCNGVRQGLAASLFSHCARRREDFLTQAQAGILRLDAATDGAAPDAPFGGWKLSGIGPPEHGFGDVYFYTRIQTHYIQNLGCNES